MIFISAPYSDDDPNVVEERVQKIQNVVAYCAEKGVVALSPVLYYHNIVKVSNLPNTFEFWREICFKMLFKCDSMWVLKLEGWESSVGIKGEIEFATLNEIPYMLRDDK